MAQRITRAEVEKVARLARLELTEDEITRFSAQLEAILEHMASLERLDTKDVPPMAQSIALVAPMREDLVRAGLGTQDVAGPAPAHEEGGFAVPRIIAGEGR